jgi:hypothetical protein
MIPVVTFQELKKGHVCCVHGGIVASDGAARIVHHIRRYEVILEGVDVGRSSHFYSNNATVACGNDSYG